jgi:hypothetical protein
MCNCQHDRGQKLTQDRIKPICHKYLAKIATYSAFAGSPPIVYGTLVWECFQSMYPSKTCEHPDCSNWLYIWIPGRLRFALHQTSSQNRSITQEKMSWTQMHKFRNAWPRKTHKTMSRASTTPTKHGRPFQSDVCLVISVSSIKDSKCEHCQPSTDSTVPLSKQRAETYLS